MRDREIIAAIVAGDPAGLAAAYDSYAAVLHAYCRSLLAEPADAADAVQDTFVIAAAKLGGLRNPDRLRPWLYAVARNECYRRLRGRTRLASLDEAGDVSDTAADASSGTGPAELRELVTAALAGLNPPDRDVIELNLRHEVEGPDLAEALGVPLNQAHALASRARGQLERSLGALLVARTGRQACAELDAILAGWDGTLTILLRKRVSRHIENCQVCGERKRRALSPAALFSVLPLIGLPPGLRHQVMRLVSDDSPEAIRYRGHIVARAGTFGPAGFPVQLSPAGRARRRGLRAHPVPYAVAAALIVLAGGGSAAYALKHYHTAAGRNTADVTVTVTVPATHATATGQPTPTASASPTTLPIAPPYTPEPAAATPGTLQVSPVIVVLAEPSPPPSPAPGQTLGPDTATFTITAENGPVTYSITAPGESYVNIAPASGTLQSGQQVQVTVSVSANASPAPINFPRIDVEPGNLVVTIHYLPSM
jgi:RNA polymerase sigma factor (sigma-70 family)